MISRALVVGIDNYPNKPLSGCVGDANQIAAILSKHQDGTKNFACKKLTAPDDHVTRVELLKNLEELFAHEADVALFYFAGHGVANNLGGYLGTIDMRQYDEGVSMVEVLTLANHSKAEQIVIILDCCHSGEFGVIPAFKNDHAVLREGISILCAGRASQAVEEKDSSGVFTALVCDALDGGASDVIGHVTVASVYAFVEQALDAWRQRPLFKAHLARLTPLRKCKPAVDLEILNRLPRHFPFSEYDFPLDPSFEQTSPAKIAENIRIFDDLKKYRDARLLFPVEATDLYFAAINSKSCKLTALGRYYWKLAKEGEL